MENKNTLLPYVFGIVAQKPKLIGDYEEICREMDSVLKSANVCGPNNIKGAVDEAIEEGKIIGVLSTKGKKIQVPLDFVTANLNQMRDGDTKTRDKADGSETLEEETDPKVKKSKEVQNKRPFHMNLRPKTGTEGAKGFKGKPYRGKPPAHNAMSKNSMANIPSPMQNENSQTPHEVRGSTSPASAKPNKVIDRKRRLHKKTSSKHVDQAAKRFKIKVRPNHGKAKKTQPPTPLLNEDAQNCHEVAASKSPVSSDPNNETPKRRKQPFRKAAQGKSYRY